MPVSQLRHVALLKRTIGYCYVLGGLGLSDGCLGYFEDRFAITRQHSAGLAGAVIDSLPSNVS